MLIIKDEGRDYQGEELNFSLLGIVDVLDAMNRCGQKELFHFFSKKHPAKAGGKLKPLWVRDIQRNDSGDAMIFALFVATKEANPDSNRVLPTEADLASFREENKVVEFKDEWNNWEELLREKNQ